MIAVIACDLAASDRLLAFAGASVCDTELVARACSGVDLDDNLVGQDRQDGRGIVCGSDSGVDVGNVSGKGGVFSPSDNVGTACHDEHESGDGAGEMHCVLADEKDCLIDFCLCESR